MTGSLLLDRIILGICLALSLAVCGLFIYTESFYKKKLPNNREETSLLSSDSKNVVVTQGHTIKKIIVNLPNEGSRLRFINLAIIFIPFEQKQIAFLEKNNDILLDIVLTTTSSMNAQELNSITGKILLEERLKKNIHLKLGDDLIKEIFFTNYVIQ